MRRLITAFILFNLIVIGLWFTADTLFPSPYTAKAFGESFTQLSGILSTAMMSLAILLAVRPKWLEPVLNGIDKMYRLHKWLAIGALVTGVAHWLLKIGGGPHGPPGDGAAATSQTLLESLRGPAHGVAQPAMFLLFALIAMALIKRVPYRLFAKTHTFIILPFLVLAFHSIALLKAEYWSGVVGWGVTVITLVGVIGCLMALFGLIGAGRKVQGKVVSSLYYPELHVLETTLKLDAGWRGHKPGQFAFITTDKKEGPHPFTIATDWDAKLGTIGFIAKELGDHTSQIRTEFAEGRAATLEGPYGMFTFDDDKPVQIWIGAGIGITPFVARMRELSKVPGNKRLYLFHSTAEVSDIALQRMRQDALAANVTLHILVSPRDGRLTAAAIQQAVPAWKQASLWFCGPTLFGSALKLDFTRAGLAMSDFHQELFEMR